MKLLGMPRRLMIGFHALELASAVARANLSSKRIGLNPKPEWTEIPSRPRFARPQPNSSVVTFRDHLWRVQYVWDQV